MFVWYGFGLANVITSTQSFFFLVESKSSTLGYPILNLLPFHLSLSTLLLTVHVGADPQPMETNTVVLIPPENLTISLMNNQAAVTKTPCSQICLGNIQGSIYNFSFQDDSYLWICSSFFMTRVPCFSLEQSGKSCLKVCVDILNPFDFCHADT